MLPQNTIVIPREEWLEKRRKTLARAIYGQFNYEEKQSPEVIGEWLDELRSMIPSANAPALVGLLNVERKNPVAAKSKLILQALTTEPKTVKEISEITQIDYSNCYNILTGLLKLVLVARKSETFGVKNTRFRYSLTPRGLSCISKQ